MQFPTPYQEFIYKRTYARWVDEKGRRENWNETINRYQGFFRKRLQGKVPPAMISEFVRACVLMEHLEIMPSMRSLWTAGEALDRENIAGYNCAYTVVDSIKSFAEILYILMNGTGVGFSVERQYIAKLPEVPYYLPNIPSPDAKRIVFEDSKLGWAEGYLNFLTALFKGECASYDLSLIRPKGARLKTFGGRASGPEPLKELLDFTRATLIKARGRKLNSLECYDLVCMIANCVVVGGVRRSATINLSNFSDQRMRHAKDGQFWIENPQRQLSNNSVAYTEKPDMTSFMEEWLNLTRSGSGERGIINRQGLQKAAAHLGRTVADYGVNPCGEIVLRPKQFCNLSEVVIRSSDSLSDLRLKVRYATILGIMQSTLTDFNFLDETWKKNSEEERLLGLSLTGLADHAVLNGSLGYQEMIIWLTEMKRIARETANEWADALGINRPAAITCVKPSGTVSQLVDSASGLHPRYAPFYIRRVRVTATDPICQYLESRGVSWNPEVGQERDNCNTKVFDFPIRSPETAVIRNQKTALEQLEYWLVLKTYWCDHNPSCTIYVKEHEWLEVGAWVYRNWDLIGGLSFLPYDGGHYALAPYEEIDKSTYDFLDFTFPTLDFSELTQFETADLTQGSREFACQGGVCEI